MQSPLCTFTNTIGVMRSRCSPQQYPQIPQALMLLQAPTHVVETVRPQVTLKYPLQTLLWVYPVPLPTLRLLAINIATHCSIQALPSLHRDILSCPGQLGIHSNYIFQHIFIFALSMIAISCCWFLPVLSCSTDPHLPLSLLIQHLCDPLTPQLLCLHLNHSHLSTTFGLQVLQSSHLRNCPLHPVQHPQTTMKVYMIDVPSLAMITCLTCSCVS